MDCRSYTWFVAFTPPQKEFTAEKLLGDSGLATFFPTRRELHWSNGADAARGWKGKRVKEYPLFPRYVFIGMLEPMWIAVWGLTRDPHRVVTSILGVDDVPAVVPHKPLWALMQRHGGGEFTAPESHRYMVTGREFSEGDRVLTDDGLFEGLVENINGTTAQVIVKMLGASRQVTIPLENLIAAE